MHLEGIVILLVLLNALNAGAHLLHLAIHLEAGLGGAILAEDFPADAAVVSSEEKVELAHAFVATQGLLIWDHLGFHSSGDFAQRQVLALISRVIESWLPVAKKTVVGRQVYGVIVDGAFKTPLHCRVYLRVHILVDLVLNLVGKVLRSPEVLRDRLVQNLKSLCGCAHPSLVHIVPEGACASSAVVVSSLIFHVLRKH